VPKLSADALSGFISAGRVGMPRPSRPRVFLLSPARLAGERARLLFNPVTLFPVARALRSDEGAPIGEVFSFLSGLYFRGKLAYAEAFARPPAKLSSGVFVITTNRGLLPASTRVTLDDLAAFAAVGIDHASGPFRAPLQRDAEALAQASAGAANRFCWAASPARSTSTCCCPSLASGSCSRLSLSVEVI
jgi:hypothetical protein